MKILHLLHCYLAQGFYRWAMSEINPLNEDVGKIVIRQSQLSDKFKKLTQE